MTSIKKETSPRNKKTVSQKSSSDVPTPLKKTPTTTTRALSSVKKSVLPRTPSAPKAKTPAVKKPTAQPIQKKPIVRKPRTVNTLVSE